MTAKIVWLVDDDDVLREAIAATLAFAGYQVVQFAGSVAPFERLESGAPIDLLIADVKLGPNQPHGVALVCMMRTRRPRLPCILITAFNDVADDVGNGIALLRKPLALDCFPETVGAILRNCAVAPSAANRPAYH
jgi:DNA-binding NtrC family response regulator